MIRLNNFSSVVSRRVGHVLRQRSKCQRVWQCRYRYERARDRPKTGPLELTVLNLALYLSLPCRDRNVYASKTIYNNERIVATYLALAAQRQCMFSLSPPPVPRRGTFMLSN